MAVLSPFRHMLGGNLKMEHADWLNHSIGLPIGYVANG